MSRKEIINIAVGTSIHLTYQNIGQPVETLFREFIDNSLDSFLTPKNLEQLNAIDITKCVVSINIRNNNYIKIRDNAFGMNKEEFGRALTLNKVSENYRPNSYGQFGMGLKYAAIQLGDSYTIETTALNSKEKYKATISKTFLQNNQTELEIEVIETDPNEHYTEITIHELRTKTWSEKDIDKLINNLAKIYNRLLDTDLEIVFHPNRKVHFEEPNYAKDDYNNDMWSSYLGEFYHKGKVYSYSGWIAALEKGNTDLAKISLLKDNRVIELGFKPSELYGKPNSFQYQRLIGEIVLNDLQVDFNKNRFQWEDGLQEAFINSLKSKPEIIEMVKFVKDLRIRGRAATPGKKQTKTLNENIKDQFSKVSNEPSAPFIITEPKDITNIENIKPDDFEPVIIPYHGTNYKFNINYIDEPISDLYWLNIERQNSDDPNEYTIIINNNYFFHSELKKHHLKLLHSLIVYLVLSQIESVKNGLKDSHIFISTLNHIVKEIAGVQ